MPVKAITVYVVRTAIATPFRIDRRKRLSDRTYRITLSFGQEQRKRIMTARNKCRNRLNRTALNFYGLKVVREEERENIQSLVDTYDAVLREVHPSLGAAVRFVPVVLDSHTAELREQMVAAIKSQVLETVMERVKKLAKHSEMPERSKKALAKLLDTAERWNVVGDSEVTKTIEQLRRGLVSAAQPDLISVSQTVEAELQQVHSVGSYVEL
ncbi:MAG: hypothetical protein KGI98_14865 [Euryarchaeota archaeon]|nr:hypothetical protein [Euryarchaeota archaeon]MDE1879449.1 hypothetical protein [Euryarchaeota archaeon]